MTKNPPVIAANLSAKVSYNATSLTLPEGMTIEEWAKCGESLIQIKRSDMWWIGDWLVFGERKFSEKYAQAVDLTGLDYDTVRAAQWVAAKFPVVSRLTNVPWSYYQTVAGLDTDAAVALLKRVAADPDKWDRAKLRDQVRLLKAKPINPKPEDEPDRRDHEIETLRSALDGLTEQLDEANEQIATLKDALAKGSVPEDSDAGSHIDQLREENWRLLGRLKDSERMVFGLTKSRDQYQAKAAALEKHVAVLQKKLDKVGIK